MNDKETELWTVQFDERQRGLIHSCQQYVIDGAPGLPGHQLMLIVAKMATLLDLSAGVPLATPEGKEE